MESIPLVILCSNEPVNGLTTEFYLAFMLQSSCNALGTPTLLTPDFMRRLISLVSLTAFVFPRDISMVYQAAPHQAKYARECVAKEPKILVCSCYSGNSPELNPDEQVWNQLKEKLGKAAFNTKDDFVSFVTSKMRSLQNMPEVVKVFFRLHDACYACRSDYHSGTT